MQIFKCNLSKARVIVGHSRYLIKLLSITGALSFFVFTDSSFTHLPTSFCRVIVVTFRQDSNQQGFLYTSLKKYIGRNLDRNIVTLNGSHEIFKSIQKCLLNDSCIL